MEYFSVPQETIDLLRLSRIEIRLFLDGYEQVSTMPIDFRGQNIDQIIEASDPDNDSSIEPSYRFGMRVAATDKKRRIK
jgi:hypothetical protein